MCLDRLRLLCLDMKGHSTRDRADRRQLNVILDAGLVELVRTVAADRQMTVTQFVSDALEVALDGHVESGSGGGVVSVAAGDGVGSVDGRDRQRGAVSDAAGRGVAPDWDAVLAAGIQNRIAVASAAYAPLVDAAVRSVLDPIEEIA